jgi:hypothetical protein
MVMGKCCPGMDKSGRAEQMKMVANELFGQILGTKKDEDLFDSSGVSPVKVRGFYSWNHLMRLLV